MIEVAAGVFWARIPLPFRLDHVNIYIIEDGDGWAVVERLLEDLEPLEDPLWLVIDDLHELHSAEALSSNSERLRAEVSIFLAEVRAA